MTLFEVTKEIGRRNASIFVREANGQRPAYGGTKKFHDRRIVGITSSSTSNSMETMAPSWVPVTTLFPRLKAEVILRVSSAVTGLPWLENRLQGLRSPHSRKRSV
jgi:hypothetical protein